MSLSASLSPAASHHLFQFCYMDLKWKQKRLEFLKPQRRNFQYFRILRSVFNGRGSSSVSDNGATEPARILLERLFAQTQKLEEQIGKDPHSPHVTELGVNLGKLESDLQVALAALKKKEEELQDAEKKVFFEYNEINLAKKDLEQREEEIMAARLKQETIEEELRLANIDLASQAAEITDLKLCLKKRDEEMSASQSALSSKEEEITRMKQELMMKREEAASAKSELRSKSMLLDKASKIVEEQEIELQELQRAIQKKEEGLEISISMQKSESEKLKVTEANLQKQTMAWLAAQEELKKLAEETSKHTVGANETLGEFGRVRKLLSDVRSELVSTQRALSSSRLIIEDQDQLLGKQLGELEEQRRSVMSYMTSLRDAEVEMKSERAKLRVAEAQYKELERDLLMEKELVSELQNELKKERSSLKQVIEEMSALQEELEQRSAAFEQSETTLKAKESELVDARLEIENLKRGQASLQIIVEERDLELSDTKKMLEEVNQEIADLRGILSSREDELIQAISTLKEKDEHVHTMQHELSDAKLKFLEAESVVEKIVNLTKDVVLSLNGEGYRGPGPVDQHNVGWPPQSTGRPADSLMRQKKQLEAELEFTRESLRAKEVEVVAAQKALYIKDEELKMVLQKLDAREKETAQLKEEIMRDKDDLKQLYALAQKRIGERSIGDLAIEKLQIEAAQLEVEAAISALQKITEMSGELLNKASLSIEADYDTDLSEQNGSEAIPDNGCSGGDVKSEVSRLLTLTEHLVREAGIITCDTSQ